MVNQFIAIIGGGASGFFAAIRAAELAKKNGTRCEVHIFESAPHYLQKVRISGGGRCNVTHHQFNTGEFVQNYPRGKNELRSPFSQFQAEDTVAWFKEKGVRLVAEEDGRMFPSTNKSDTIINCFMKTAEKLDIQIHTRCAVQNITKDSEQFHLFLKNGETVIADKILIATGSAKAGYAFAKGLGHAITQLAPSLFSFKIQHPILKELPGTSFHHTLLKLNILGAKSFAQKGPLLITHWGLSGPAILKLSAWAARELKQSGYKGTLTVNWSGLTKQDDVRQMVESIKRENSKSLIKNISPELFTKRFWHNLLSFLDIDDQKKWMEISKKDLARLIENIFAMILDVQGQNRFKDEFVECGGIKLKEVNFKTMESKITPGLYFSGEILDIDGITGGFNFQNAWTTGFIAGSNMVLL